MLNPGLFLGFLSCALLIACSSDIEPQFVIADAGRLPEECAADQRIGQECSIGKGECTSQGKYECTIKGAVVCDAVPGEPATERCGTDQDEDCDGKVDEAPEGRCCSNDDCGSLSCSFAMSNDEDGEATEPLDQGGLCVDSAEQAATEGQPGDCESGECTECEPGDRRCGEGDSPSVEVCESGKWKTQACPFVCTAGQCEGECKPGERRCGGGASARTEHCSDEGQWETEAQCPLGCSGGSCVLPSCGDGVVTEEERCDNGDRNQPEAYGEGPQPGVCTTACQPAGYCGDRVINGPEECDDGADDLPALGACNPDCTGIYERKAILLTSSAYGAKLGGAAGADRICQTEFGDTYKALIVGGARRATVTPLAGDGQLDWVLKPYTYYFNSRDELIWQTGDIALLGVRDRRSMALLANVYIDDQAVTAYAWSGWKPDDWTTWPDDPAEALGTCRGWTDDTFSSRGNFTGSDLFIGASENTQSASEPCDASLNLLCVEQ